MKKLVSAVLIALLAGMPALAEARGSEKPAKPTEVANDAGLTVLDLSVPSLSWRVKRVLMETAAEDPER